MDMCLWPWSEWDLAQVFRPQRYKFSRWKLYRSSFSYSWRLWNSEVISISMFKKRYLFFFRILLSNLSLKKTYRKLVMRQIRDLVFLKIYADCWRAFCCSFKAYFHIFDSAIFTKNYFLNSLLWVSHTSVFKEVFFLLPPKPLPKSDCSGSLMSCHL